MKKQAKRARFAGTLGLVALAGIASSLAVAQDPGPYLGLNAGQSRAQIDDERITRSLLSAGFTTTSIADDDRDLGYKLFGGYRFNRYLAIEGGYFDLGEFGFTATTDPPGTLTGAMEVKGLNLDAVAMLPFTEKFSAFARVGANYAESEARFAGSGAVSVPDPDREESGTNYKFGAGIEYAFTRSFGVRAEAERYRIDDAVGNKGDIDLASLGLVYRFVGKAPAPVARVVTPEPVAAAPPPPPPPVMAPAPPMRRKVTFSADALFAFDKATLKPEGKQALDQFAANLSGTTFEVITVTGHTDRIGSDAYNLALSGRRAEAVKAHLVASGISAGKVAASGSGESSPMTKPGECTGPTGARASKALIACLQPDRRVEVEVSGTQ